MSFSSSSTFSKDPFLQAAENKAWIYLPSNPHTWIGAYNINDKYCTYYYDDTSNKSWMSFFYWKSKSLIKINNFGNLHKLDKVAGLKKRPNTACNYLLTESN